MKKFFSLWLPMIFWAGFIFYLSSLQVKPPTGTFLDLVLPYLVHLTEYGILFILIWRVNKKVGLCLILGVLYAFSDELHQAFVPGRTPDIIDVLTDILGMLTVWMIIWKLLPKAPLKLKNLAKTWQIS